MLYMSLMLLHLYSQYHLEEVENLPDLGNQVMSMVIHQIHPNVNAKKKNIDKYSIRPDYQKWSCNSLVCMFNFFCESCSKITDSEYLISHNY